jgi:integrase
VATLDKRGGGYRLIFYFRGRRFQHALKAETAKEAKQLQIVLERNLELLHQGALILPEGADLGLFLVSGGQVTELPKAEKPLTLGAFIDQYQANRPPSKERNTTYTENIHLAHVRRLLGDHVLLRDIPAALQDYVSKRSTEKGRGDELVSRVTVKKELGTLTSIWNRWGMNCQLVASPLSIANLEYSKQREKPPFQSWDKLMQKTKGDPESDLWESVFLTTAQVEELLAHVKDAKYKWKNSHFPWIYPMFAFCGYTGTRRSEMLRARVEDVDFDSGELTIREKKKDRSKKETYRHVPMRPELKAVLEEWLVVHPGGDILFCKKAGEPFTVQMANHYFRWALDSSKWKPLRGYHAFRHSLISNLACHGVTDRIIMGLVGHLNPATTRRYQHLFPSTVKAALDLVFGGGTKVLEADQGGVGD